MSEPLNSFIVRVGKPLQPADYDGSSAFLNDTSQTAETTFLTNQTEAPESFLSLGEPSVTNTTSSGIEIEDGDHVLLNGNDGGVEEVTAGPLLYLDPSSGLHVLVHSLCQTFQHSNGSQDGVVTPDQFVVVGALQTDEPMVLEPSLESLDTKSSNINTSTSVDNILHSPILSIENSTRDDPAVHRIFSSTVEPTLDLGMGIPSSQNYVCASESFKDSPSSLVDVSGIVTGIDNEKLQLKGSPQINCSDPPVLKLQVTDEGHTISSGELQRDILMEAVPHINLEEIIEKFTSDNAGDMIKYDKSEGIISEKENEYSANIESVSIHPGEELPLEKTFSVLLDENLKTPPRSNITVKLKSTTNLDESIDEESLYDIVMTYKCKLCSEVFIDKERLLEHYKEVHKPKKGVKICVTSKNNTPLEALHTPPNSNVVTKVTVSTLNSGTYIKKTENLGYFTCKHCSHMFSDEQEYRKHIAKVHNIKESGKEMNRGSRGGLNGLTVQPGILIGHCEDRLKNQAPSEGCKASSDESKSDGQKHRNKAKKINRGSQRSLNGLTIQPGILIGHREDRLQNQAPSEGGKASSDESISDGQKRRIKAPKDLQQQFLLQKQRPRPVLTKEVKKVFKCSITSCRYKFSTKEKVHEHEEYHRYCGDSKENYFCCIHCSEKFKKWSVCLFHVWKAHGIDIDLLTCGICQTYKTNTEQKLVIHQKIHSDSRDYICKVCGKGFHQPAQLLNHGVIHISNPEDQPLCHQEGYCSECDRWYGDKKSLKRHIDAVHLKIKPNKCPQCSYTNVRVFDLMVHMRKHTGEKPHKCELCGHSYRYPTTIRHHRRIHFLIKPYKCPYENCQFEGCSGPRFKKHVAKNHPGTEAVFKCQVCTLETQNIREYVKHYSVHEEQLFKEAFEKRTVNSVVSAVSHPSGENMTSEVESSGVDEKNKQNIKVTVVTDEVNNACKADAEENEGKVAFSKITPETFVFESIDGDSNVTLQNPQVYTIKMEDLKPSGNTHKKFKVSNTSIRSSSEVQKSAAHEEPPRLEDLLKTHVLDPSQQEKSVLSVSQKNNNDFQKLLEPPIHETTVLRVVENSGSTPVLEVEDQTLMTFSEVISEDGQQYIIGISPEDISSNNIGDQSDIFTIVEDDR